MLIELHLLQNHAPSNLNRDDTGSPKQCIFGGVRRARISSQCLKRSLRRSPIFAAEFPEDQRAQRTRRLPQLIRDRLIKDGLEEDLADAAARKASGFGTKEGAERDELATAQTMFLTQADIDAVYQVIKAAALEAGSAKKLEKVKAKELQAQAELKGWRPRTIDLALFGRMITSPAFEDVEAAMQVAHAISTHRVDHEFDYYTAVDDLQGREEDDESAGADMIGDTEFNSACYYKYFSLDLAGLIDNLARSGQPESNGAERLEAQELIRRALPALLKAVIHTTPTGKQNAFAAHQLPDAILIEARPHPTPVSYANAFAEPVRPAPGQENLVGQSIQRLVEYADTLTRKFSLATAGRLWFTTHDLVPRGTDKAPVKRCDTLDDLLEGLENLLNQSFGAVAGEGRHG